MSEDTLEHTLARLETEPDEQGRQHLWNRIIEHIKGSRRGFSAKKAITFLEPLQNRRDFANLEKVADALLNYGSDHPGVRRRYAQALIERGSLAAAIAILDTLATAATKKSDPAEYDEALGLLGRAYKQLYLNSSGLKRAKTLEKAIDSYMRGYRRNRVENYWHGINAAAMLHRAATDRVRLNGKYSGPRARAREIGAEIRTVLEAKSKLSPWDTATIAEAYLVLGDFDKALFWYSRFANTDAVRAFTLGSTLRQLQEVWRLDSADERAREIVSMVQSALLAKEGGVLDLKCENIDIEFLHDLQEDKQFEAVLGNDAFNSYRWFVLAIDRAHNVAQILDPTDTAVGTGFLVRGSDIAASLGDEKLLLTNAHVISENERDRGALSRDQARIKFELFDDAAVFRAKEVIWSSPKDEHDATLLRLDRVPKAKETFPIARSLPLADGNQRVYIIGHPKGMKLQFSIKDNKLLALKDRFVHYRAPTQGGSSGSPVFNEFWELIALHHAGGFNVPKLDGDGVYAANEGISILSIVEQIRSSLAA